MPISFPGRVSARAAMRAPASAAPRAFARDRPGSRPHWCSAPGQRCAKKTAISTPSSTVWPKYWNGGSACTSQGDRAYRSAELRRRVAMRLPRLDHPIASRRIGVPGLNPLGVRSRRLLMVIAQEPTQSLPALNRLRLVADIRITREQQDVTLALVIPLGMIMLDVFVQRPPQGALAQKDHLGQALRLHRPNSALRIGIQVRTAGRQRERFNLT